MDTSATSRVSDWKVDQLDNLAGKTYLITGANSGIGYHAAAHLRRANANVLLAARSVDKGKRAAAMLAETSGSGEIELVQLDLASLDSIATAAEQSEARPTDSMP